MATKYTPTTYLKAVAGGLAAALGSAAVVAGGPDLSVLSLGEWLGVAGAGLSAAGVVFGTPNKDVDKPPAASVADAVDVIITAQQTVAGVAAAAAADGRKIEEALTGLAGTAVTTGLAAVERAIDLAR